MTYNTCHIDVLKDAAIERVPDFGILREQLLPDLMAPPGGTHYWLRSVSNWAKAHGKSIHYIDNCWIEVELSAEELIRFLRDTYPSNIAEDVMHSVSLSVQDRYIVVAEEF